jgi:hypothetical protein
MTTTVIASAAIATIVTATAAIAPAVVAPAIVAPAVIARSDSDEATSHQFHPLGSARWPVATLKETA